MENQNQASLMFEKHANELIELKQKFNNGELKSLEYSGHREASIKAALIAFGLMHGTKLNPNKLFINANGELLLSTSQDDSYYSGVCEPFSDYVCDVLNKYARPRCGVGSSSPATMMHGHSGWCYVNHFDAEKMIQSVYQEIQLRRVQENEQNPLDSLRM